MKDINDVEAHVTSIQAIQDQIEAAESEIERRLKAARTIIRTPNQDPHVLRAAFQELDQLLATIHEAQRLNDIEAQEIVAATRDLDQLEDTLSGGL